MSDFLTRIGKTGVLFAFVLALGIPAMAQLSLRKAMDYDGDNKADFTVFRPENNVWYISKSGGGFTFQQFGLSNSDYPAPGDFDGDGKGDISVWRDSDGIWYRLNSIDNTFHAVGWGITGDEPIARDYDGDGKTDQAVVRRTNGNMIWYILKSGPGGGFTAAQFGLSTDFTAPGDYNGDGSFDLAIQRPGPTATSQAFFYILNSGTGTLSVIPWGFSNDLVVPGDYDGDGKTDVSVVREGNLPTDNLVWYILLSSNNSFLIRSFGLTGDDLNVQNDYDGNGTTDIAVWRNSNGSFYYLMPDGNINVSRWGAPNDFPVASYDTH